MSLHFGHDLMLAVGGTVPPTGMPCWSIGTRHMLPRAALLFPIRFNEIVQRLHLDPGNSLHVRVRSTIKRDPQGLKKRKPERLESVSAICRVGHNGIDDHPGLGLATQVCSTPMMMFRPRKGEMACQNSGA